jgi:predicted nucleic acid-binding Zn ribbon protein
MIMDNSQQGRSGKRLKPVGGVLDSLMRSLGVSRQYQGWMVVQAWPEIVGEMIAQRAPAIGFEDGVLFVAVADPSWRQELSMQLESIMREIRNRPYGRAVKQVRLVHGRKGQ